MKKAFSQRSGSRPTKARPEAGPKGHPIVGAHQSIAGGLTKAVDAAIETGCECLQIFTRNINRWDVSPIDPDKAEAFKHAVVAANLKLVVAHDSYLINPASANGDLRQKSIDGLVIEITRADVLAIPWVVAHPGAAGEQAIEEAITRAAAGIAEALDRTRHSQTGILIETTAGQGTCLGATFTEIAAMLKQIDARGFSSRVGVCLDTCHVFAAGYALSPAKEFAKTLQEFDRLIGLKRLVVIHANDSKREQGSRVDRHEAIGQGKIGREAFALIMNHPKLTRIPKILETPKEGDDGKRDPAKDRHNLAVLRDLVE